jgi:hypothetical protein
MWTGRYFHLTVVQQRNFIVQVRVKNEPINNCRGGRMAVPRKMTKRSPFIAEAELC